MVDCPQCGEEFTRQASLNRHIKSKHNGIQHECSHCHRMFSRGDVLKRHQQSHEDVIAMEACPICSQPFTRKDYLIQHQRSCRCGRKRRSTRVLPKVRSDPPSASTRTSPSLPKLSTPKTFNGSRTIDGTYKKEDQVVSPGRTNAVVNNSDKRLAQDSDRPLLYINNIDGPTVNNDLEAMTIRYTSPTSIGPGTLDHEYFDRWMLGSQLGTNLSFPLHRSR